MKSVRWPLMLAYLAAGVFLILFTFITFLGGNRIGFLYSRVPGFSALRSVLQWAGIIASLGFFVAGAIVAIPIAVERAAWPHKVLAVLPVLLLLFALGGILAYALGIGTVGQMGFWPLLGPVTFATGWLALGTALAVAAVVIAVAAAGHIGPRPQRAAGFTLGATSLAAVIAAVATIGLLVLVANNQPSLPRFNRDNPQASLGGTGAARQGEPAQGRQGGPQGQNQGGGPGSGAGGGEGSFGRNGGRRAVPPGEGEGGFGPAGGGFATIRQQFTTAGMLLVLAALVEVFSTLAVLATGRAATGAAAAPATTPADTGGHGAGGAILAGIGVILVAFGLIQLVPVSRTDPPAQSTVQWDSPQTQQLWQRACADCHSNQTQWPWYTAIAPGSWLIAGHVNAGRQSLNVSELSGNAGFRRAPGAGESAGQIRSGAMPPADYLLIHPAARLTPAEKQQLIQGLQNTFGR